MCTMFGSNVQRCSLQFHKADRNHQTDPEHNNIHITITNVLTILYYIYVYKHKLNQ